MPDRGILRHHIISPYSKTHDLVEKTWAKSAREKFFHHLEEMTDQEIKDFSWSLPIRPGDRVTLLSSEPVVEFYSICIYLQRRLESSIQIFCSTGKEIRRIPFILREMKGERTEGVLDYDTKVSCSGDCASCSSK